MSGGTAPLWRSTRHWLSRLMTQLHDRNCRRRFVRPEAFHSLEAVGTASMLVSEVCDPAPCLSLAVCPWCGAYVYVCERRRRSAHHRV